MCNWGTRCLKFDFFLQMEGAGPPPMPTDNIGQIPKVKITDSQAGRRRGNTVSCLVF
jgi:hypothetical protein